MTSAHLAAGETAPETENGMIEQGYQEISVCVCVCVCVCVRACVFYTLELSTCHVSEQCGAGIHYYCSANVPKLSHILLFLSLSLSFCLSLSISLSASVSLCLSLS